jgi:hypothetical protein
MLDGLAEIIAGDILRRVNGGEPVIDAAEDSQEIRPKLTRRKRKVRPVPKT